MRTDGVDKDKQKQHYCDEVDSLVDPYLDGELVSPDREGFQEHLRGCVSCKQRVRKEAEFRAQLRASLVAPPVPEHLHAAILATIDAEVLANQPTASAYRGRILPAIAVAVAAAAVGVFAWMSGGGIDTPATTPVAQIQKDAVLVHRASAPLEVTGRQRASTMVRRRLHRGHQAVPSLPRFSGTRFSLQGARRSRIRNRDAVALKYVETAQNMRSRSVQALVFDASDLRHKHSGELELSATQVDGFSVIMFKGRQGTGYVFTSEMSIDELWEHVMKTELLASALRQSRRLRDE